MLTRAAELEAREIVQKARIEATDVTRQARLDGEAEGRVVAERLRADEEERARREVARLKQEEDCLARREQGITDKERLLLDRERANTEKEGLVGGRETEVTRREREAVDCERTTRALESQAIRLVDDRRATLEAIAGLSGEDARRQIIEQQLDSARKSAAREAKAIEDAARDEAEKRAKRIVGIAVQRYAGDHVQERAVTTVHLPNDEMKGRIIGREGRNIRALQEATGVDFIVDDTPETIVIAASIPSVARWRVVRSRVVLPTDAFIRRESKRSCRSLKKRSRGRSCRRSRHGRACDHPCAPRPHASRGAAQIPLQLRAERAQALDRVRLFLRG